MASLADALANSKHGVSFYFYKGMRTQYPYAEDVYKQQERLDKAMQLLGKQMDNTEANWAQLFKGLIERLQEDCSRDPRKLSSKDLLCHCLCVHALLKLQVIVEDNLNGTYHLLKSKDGSLSSSVLGGEASHFVGTGSFSKVCLHCGSVTGNMRCSGCFSARYCGKECQRAHWASHKHECKSVKRQSVLTLNM